MEPKSRTDETHRACIGTGTGAGISVGAGTMSTSSVFTSGSQCRLRDGLKKRVCSAIVSEVALEATIHLPESEGDNLCLWQNFSLRN